MKKKDYETFVNYLPLALSIARWYMLKSPSYIRKELRYEATIALLMAISENKCEQITASYMRLRIHCALQERILEHTIRVPKTAIKRGEQLFAFEPLDNHGPNGESLQVTESHNCRDDILFNEILDRYIVDDRERDIITKYINGMTPRDLAAEYGLMPIDIRDIFRAFINRIRRDEEWLNENF